MNKFKILLVSLVLLIFSTNVIASINCDDPSMSVIPQRFQGYAKYSTSVLASKAVVATLAGQTFSTTTNSAGWYVFDISKCDNETSNSVTFTICTRAASQVGNFSSGGDETTLNLTISSACPVAEEVVGGGGTTPGAAAPSIIEEEVPPEEEEVPPEEEEVLPIEPPVKPVDEMIKEAGEIVDNVVSGLEAGTMTTEQASEQLETVVGLQEEASVEMTEDVEIIEALEAVTIEDLGLDETMINEGKELLKSANELIAQAGIEEDVAKKADLLKQASVLQTEALEKLPEVDVVAEETAVAETTKEAIESVKKSATTGEAKRAVEKVEKGEAVKIEKKLKTYKITNKEVSDKEVYKSKIELKLKAEQEMKDVDIIEDIPKTVASDVNEITFLGEQPTVLQADPIVQWSFDVIKKGEEKDLSYVVDKKLEALESVTVAAAQEIAKEEVKKGYGWLMVLIVVVLGIVLYYYIKKKKEY